MSKRQTVKTPSVLSSKVSIDIFTTKADQKKEVEKEKERKARERLEKQEALRLKFMKLQEDKQKVRQKYGDKENDPVLSMNYSQQVVNPFSSPYFMNPTTSPMMLGQFMQPTQSMPQPQQSAHQVSASIKFPMKSLKFKF